MDPYWLAEIGGAAVACALAAAVTTQVVAGELNLMLVAGIGMTAAIAAAANRQARVRHTAAVAEEAPVEDGPVDEAPDEDAPTGVDR